MMSAYDQTDAAGSDSAQREQPQESLSGFLNEQANERKPIGRLAIALVAASLGVLAFTFDRFFLQVSSPAVVAPPPLAHSRASAYDEKPLPNESVTRDLEPAHSDWQPAKPDQKTTVVAAYNLRGVKARPGAPAPTSTDNGLAQALQAAYAALRANQFDDAAQRYTHVLKVWPQERDAWLGLACIAHRTGQWEQAQRHYEEVLRLDPDNVQAQSGLAALQPRGASAQAIARMRDLTQHQPQAVSALDTLGVLLSRDARWGEARQAFERAQSLEPGDARQAYQLAVALDHLHESEAASIWYATALAVSSGELYGAQDTFPRAQARERLRQLSPTGLHPKHSAHE